MIDKKNKGEYIFSTNKTEKIKVLFLPNGNVELNALEEDDEVVLLKFGTIKEFRVFCNSITDIIEYKDSEEQ